MQTAQNYNFNMHADSVLLQEGAGEFMIGACQMTRLSQSLTARCLPAFIGLQSEQLCY